ncbi:MAG: non-canonical purine NTP pyrophosphatase [Actinobacteria bacterium]|nr:MAG: non-canonical purine NTP pyrophosphatase [Actinomycetota bacterium]
MTAVLCSSNEHKARELERLLPGWTIELLGVDAFPPETGATYYDNAAAKARFGREIGPADAWMLGEDSGIEVDGLDGGPGVRSARSAAGDEVGWMLHALDDDERRGARYVCELVALAPDGREFRGTGTVDGRIAHEPRGTEGFGFDPVFVPGGEEQTVAELGDDWKARHSHRANAARALLSALAAAPASHG